MAKQIHVRSILEGYFNGLSFNNIARTRHLGKRRAWRARELFYTECRTCSCIETTLQRKKFLKKLANYDFLIIDEWPSDPLNEKQLSFIYELVEKRTEVHSTIFCGQFSTKEWYARLKLILLNLKLFFSFLFFFFILSHRMIQIGLILSS